MFLDNIPDNYREKCRIDLQSDIQAARIIARWNLLSFFLVEATGALFKPISSIFEGFNGEVSFGALLLKVVLIGSGIVLYIFLHEWCHALFMKIFGAKDVHCNVSLKYVSTGCRNGCFRKHGYQAIVISPFVIFTAIIIPLAICVRQIWFWVFWTVGAYHFSGCVADLYIFYIVTTVRDDTLIRDDGSAITIYNKKL